MSHYANASGSRKAIYKATSSSSRTESLGAMSISFRMNITTPSVPHNGLLVSTGVHASSGSYGNGIRSNTTDGTRDLLEMWRGVQNQGQIQNSCPDQTRIQEATAITQKAVTCKKETESQSIIETEMYKESRADLEKTISCEKMVSSLDFDTSLKNQNRTQDDKLSPRTDASTMAALLSPLSATSIDKKADNTASCDLLEISRHIIESEKSRERRVPIRLLSDAATTAAALPPRPPTRGNAAENDSKQTSQCATMPPSPKPRASIAQPPGEALTIDEFECEPPAARKPSLSNLSGIEAIAANFHDIQDSKRFDADSADQYSILAKNTQIGTGNGRICRSCDNISGVRHVVPIKLNVFSLNNSASTASKADANTSVELYVPEGYDYDSDGKGRIPSASNEEDFVEDETITTTTTTVEIFREKLEDALRPVDYFRLLRDDNTPRSQVDLVRAHGPAYESATRTQTHFGNRRKTSAAPKVRWDDGLSFTSSQPSLNYIVKEPSSISSAAHLTSPFAGTTATNGRELGISPVRDSNLTGVWDSRQYQHQRNQSDSMMSSEFGLGTDKPDISKIGREISDASANFSSLSDLRAHSTPSFSSTWNLADGVGEIDDASDGNTSVATILRYQQRVSKERRPPPSSNDQPLRHVPSRASSANSAHHYSRIVTPSPNPSMAPPRPPKRQHRDVLRRTSSQPNIFGEDGERRAPPRPTARKPAHLAQRVSQFLAPAWGSGSGPSKPCGALSTQSLQPLESSALGHRTSGPWESEGHGFSSNPFAFRALPTPQARRFRPPASARSTSSNEIFKLYQTRDCLGNVINEL